MDEIAVKLRGGPADGRRVVVTASCSIFEARYYGYDTSRSLTYLRTKETTEDLEVIFDWFDHDDRANVVTG